MSKYEKPDMSEYERINRIVRHTNTGNWGQPPEGGWSLNRTLTVWALGAAGLAAWVFYSWWFT